MGNSYLSNQAKVQDNGFVDSLESSSQNNESSSNLLHDTKYNCALEHPIKNIKPEKVSIQNPRPIDSSDKYRYSTMEAYSTGDNLPQNGLPNYYELGSRSRYNFEPAALNKGSDPSHNSMERTINHWIDNSFSCAALPIATAFGIDILTKNRKLSCTKATLRFYGKTARYSIKTTTRAYTFGKSMIKKYKDK